MKSFSKNILLCFILIFCASKNLCAQDSVWSLPRCIDYAKENNLSVQAAIINERIAKMQVAQSRMALLPNASMSSGYGRSYGRSINPTSNQFENNAYEYAGISGSSGVTLFSWFQHKNIIGKNKLQQEAATADKEQIQNDVALNITAAYLQILLAKERITVAEEQLKLSNQNVAKTNALQEAGKSNGLDAAQVKTQLMKDSAIYFNALLAYQQSLIDIKAMLNLEFQTPFAATEEKENPAPYFLQTPEEVYMTAISWLPSIKSNRLKIAMAQKDIEIAKGKLYPSLSLGYSAGSNYSSTSYEYLAHGEQRLMNWGKQLRNNLSQSFSLSFNIPLFNNWSSRYAIKQSQFSLQQAAIQQQEQLVKLKQDIYKAWNDVQTALQVYHAAKSAAILATVGYEFAGQRYGLGLIAANDLLLAQRDKNVALIDELTAKYDWIFKMKIVEYYLDN